MQPLPIVSHDSPICLIGGARISDATFQAALNHAERFVAVDSGADFLLQKGVTPDAVIGDLDSLSDRARSAYAAKICHVAEQDTTDFEKALCRVHAPCLIAIGFTGGRLDHSLSVLGTLARHPDQPVVLLDDNDASFIAKVGKTVMTLEKATRISVMPVGQARAVSLSGVRWPFSDQRMSLDSFTSPSNEALGGEIVLQSHDPVLVTLPQTQLQAALTAAVRAG